MIVVCERCSTRFQLDEARIPARGAQVRCSRCKHAFFVAAPGSTADGVVQEVVAEATGPGGTSAPTVTTDLDHSAFDTGAAGASEGEDDQWEFNEDPPAAARNRPAPAPAPESAPQEQKPEPELDFSRPGPPPDPASEDVPDSLLDELGDPKDWDFSGEDGAEAPAPETGGRAAGVEESAPEEETPAPAPPQQAKEKRSRRKRGRKQTAGRSRSRTRSSGGISSLLLEGVGYLAVALLFGVGAGRVVERGVHRAPPLPAASAAAVPVAGSGAEGVRVEFLENATAGTIVVVRGRRSSAAPGTALRVEWTDHGRPIPGTARWAGPELPPAWLREADPGELRHLLAAAAVRPAAPNGASPAAWDPPSDRRFVAVYEAVPREATGLRFSPVVLPGASPPAAATSAATPAGTPARGEGPGSGGAGGSRPAPVGAAPSSPSPRSPRPSSG